MDIKPVKFVPLKSQKKVGAAQTWCGKMRPEALKKKVSTKFRIEYGQWLGLFIQSKLKIS